MCIKEGGAVDELLHQAYSMSFKDNTAIKELLYHAYFLFWVGVKTL